MEQNEETKKKLINALWLEIDKAIMSSINIKTLVNLINKLGHEDELCRYNYIVDGKKLIEKIADGSKGANAENKAERPGKLIDKSDEINILINGISGYSSEEIHKNIKICLN